LSDVMFWVGFFLSDNLKVTIKIIFLALDYLKKNLSLLSILQNLGALFMTFAVC